MKPYVFPKYEPIELTPELQRRALEKIYGKSFRQRIKDLIEKLKELW
jgi:hypothetical protein